MRELIVKNGDVELNVQVAGSDRDPTLLFLHGFPDCHKTWQHQVDTLQRIFQVVTFDMRGVGKSTPSIQRDAYKIKHLLSDIDAVIDAVVGPQGQVHLIGHDWGSVIGWSFITDSQYSGRALSYTSMSGPHLRLMLDWARRKLLSGNPVDVAHALKQGIYSWYVYLFNLPWLPERLFSLFGQKIWRTVLTSNGVDAADTYLDLSEAEVSAVLKNPVNLYRQNPFDPPPIPEKNGVKIPVQLLLPSEDNFVTSQLFEFYDEYVQHLSKVEIDGKHWAHHSHKHTFNQYITEFVERIELQGAPLAAD